MKVLMILSKSLLEKGKLMENYNMIVSFQNVFNKIKTLLFNHGFNQTIIFNTLNFRKISLSLNLNNGSKQTLVQKLFFLMILHSEHLPLKAVEVIC
jgi:hypothetical protein